MHAPQVPLGAPSSSTPELLKSLPQLTQLTCLVLTGAPLWPADFANVAKISTLQVCVCVCACPVPQVCMVVCADSSFFSCV